MAHFQPLTEGNYTSARRKNSTAVVAANPVQPPKGRLLTQHTGLPPRATGAAKPGRKRKA